MRKRAAERKQRRAALKQRYAEAQLQVRGLVSLSRPLSSVLLLLQAGAGWLHIRMPWVRGVAQAEEEARAEEVRAAAEAAAAKHRMKQ